MDHQPRQTPEPENQWHSRTPPVEQPCYQQVISPAQAIHLALADLGLHADPHAIQGYLRERGHEASVELIEHVRTELGKQQPVPPASL